MSEPATRGKVIAVAAIALGGFILPVLAIALLYKSCLGTTVRGSMSIRGAGLDLRQRLGGCAADADGHAVTLDGGPRATVRAIVDPIDGARLELIVDGHSPVAITAMACPGLKVTLRAVGTRGDGSAILDGAIDAACQVIGGPLAGAQLDVEAWWKSCKLPESP